MKGITVTVERTKSLKRMVLRVMEAGTEIARQVIVAPAKIMTEPIKDGYGSYANDAQLAYTYNAVLEGGKNYTVIIAIQGSTTPNKRYLISTSATTYERHQQTV